MSLARRADKYECYQQSVQEPDADVPFIERIYRRQYGRVPRSMREDFCGTAAFACAWVARHRDNVAFGIDLDPEPLDWGRQHNVAALPPEQSSRVKLIEGDVLDVGHEPVDVTVAFNFSYFLFRTRESLGHYFRCARATLGSEGMLVLDAYGGGDAQRTQTERRRQSGFTYVWEQHSFDPIHNHGVNYIHFDFPDGSRMRRAFSYDWRIWSIPEIRELLLEAGFGRVDVYWEGTDRKTSEPNGIFRLREHAQDDPAWVAYIAATP